MDDELEEVNLFCESSESGVCVKNILELDGFLVEKS
jgi:hypothetical protein